MIIGIIKKKGKVYYVHQEEDYFNLSHVDNANPAGGYYSLDSLLKLKGFTREDLIMMD